MENSAGLPPLEELESVEQNEENVTLGTAPATASPVGVLLEEGVGVDDEIDDEANVEGAVESSVQIAPTGETNPIGNENNPMLFIQLGDRVVYDSKKYGRTTGQVYYRSNELISIKPDGISNTLVDFELEDNEEEDDLEDDEDYNEDEDEDDSNDSYDSYDSNEYKCNDCELENQKGSTKVSELKPNEYNDFFSSIINNINKLQCMDYDKIFKYSSFIFCATFDA
jgi:hypothetical protein